ncbi:TetR/AcrR family transcriptional regulator [soil metagenome]
MARQRDYQKIELIYKATQELVLERGFSGLKMAEVAQKAGLATGTLYIYFKDKDDLVNQLYLYLKRQKASLWFQGNNHNDSFHLIFERFWKQFLSVSMENASDAAFLEQYYRSPFIKNTVKDESGQLLKPVYDLLDRGKKEGILKNLNSELLLAQILGPIHELVRLHREGTLQITNEVNHDAFNLVWDGIKS